MLAVTFEAAMLAGSNDDGGVVGLEAQRVVRQAEVLQLERHRGVRRIDGVVASRDGDRDRRRSGGGLSDGRGGFGDRRGGRSASGEGEEEEARAGEKRFHCCCS